jgi:hypothetical protein
LDVSDDEIPDDELEGLPGGVEGVWVLWEDGNLSMWHYPPVEPQFKTDEHGRRWIKLHPKVPIEPIIKQVEVERVPVKWPDAPDYEAKQWKAKSFFKSISVFAAGLILFRHGRRKVNEERAQLIDIHDLIRSGHADKAIQRLNQFRADYPDTKEKIVWLFSMAHHELGETQIARNLHGWAYFEGYAHEAMMEIYGAPDPADYGFGSDRDDDDHNFDDDEVEDDLR